MTLEILVKSLITIVAIALILVRKNFPAVELDTTDFGLLIAAAFPWLPSIVRSAKLPGGFEFEFNEVKRRQEQQQSQIARLIRAEQQRQQKEQERQQEEQERQQEEINLLKLLVVNTSISGNEIQHLRNLTSPEPVVYRPNPGLERDLRRLLESGLITRRPGKGVRSLMRHPGDIKEHFEVTDLGRQMLSAWERIREERSVWGEEEEPGDRA